MKQEIKGVWDDMLYQRSKIKNLSEEDQNKLDGLPEYMELVDDETKQWFVNILKERGLT